MGLIKNYSDLASNEDRKVVLELIEAGLSALQIDSVLSKNFILDGNNLKIIDKVYDLTAFERIHMIAFGKGSGTISKIMEQTLGEKLTRGFVIDVSEERFEKLEFAVGTHPLPSSQNLDFTAKVVENCQNLTEKDLVLVVICGGGSVMFDLPYKIDLAKLVEVNRALLSSGSDIIEVNTVRKHLSKTKGGGLAKILFPAKVVSLIFSDVPGNDLSSIASGPTVKDETTVDQALAIYNKINLAATGLLPEDFTETPKADEVFAKIDNILMLSNLTALNAMKEKSESMGISANIFSDKFQSDAYSAGKTLIDNAAPNSVLLVGGETTVKVKNPEGKGGRNQVVVLASLNNISANTVIASVDSDGWDNSPVAGALGDSESLAKAKGIGVGVNEYLDSDNSFLFFNSIEDAIITDRLPTNVSDLMIVYKK